MAITSRPLSPLNPQPSPAANPFIHRSFPNGQKRPVGERGQRAWGVSWKTAYPRHDTALSVPADTGKMSCGGQQRAAGRIQAQGVGPGRTCRSGSSRGRIIRANRIVLLVIQIRLSHPALFDDPGYLGNRWEERYLSPRKPFFPAHPLAPTVPITSADRFSSRLVENTLDSSTWRTGRSKKQELFLGTEAALRREMTRSVVADAQQLAEIARRWENLQSFLFCLEIIRRARVFLRNFSIRARITLVVRFAFRSDKLQAANADNGTIRFRRNPDVILLLIIRQWHRIKIAGRWRSVRGIT